MEPAVNDMPLPELHERIRALHAKCYEAYEAWRGATLARQSTMPDYLAQEVTRVQPLAHSSSSLRGLRALRIEAAYDVFKEEVLAIRSDADAIQVEVFRLHLRALGLHYQFFPRRIHMEIAIELPDAGAAIKATTRPETSVVSITKDGEVYLDGKAVTMVVLHRELRKAAQKPGARIRVDADKRTPFQHVVYVLDLCSFEGLKHIGFRTRD